MPGVLHRELVKAELLLHGVELRLRGLAQRHPDEAARAREVGADLAELDVGELAPVLVSDAVDEQAFPFPYQRSVTPAMKARSIAASLPQRSPRSKSRSSVGE